MVVLVHLLQDTERTIIPYLNKEETLEGLLNDEYRTWKNKLTNHPIGAAPIYANSTAFIRITQTASHHPPPPPYGCCARDLIPKSG